jgi:small conductance mechanosensitive channel
MFYFLQAGNAAAEVVPGVANIKEKFVEEEDKLTYYWHRIVAGVEEYTPRVIFALVVLLLGLWLIKRFAILLDKGMARKDHDISLRTFMRSLVSIGLKIILIVTVTGMLGIGTTSFAAILGAAGLAVGLALQGSLSNFAGGVLILIFKPFKVGDTIEAQGQSGDVKEIQIFNTILLTGDHKTVILPNGPLSNGTIVNKTRFGSLRVDILLEISTSNNLQKVKEVISQVLNANDKILKEPEPSITVGKIGDGIIAINVKPFCLPSDTTVLTSDLYYQFYSALEAAGVKFPAVPNFKITPNPAP